MYAKGTVIQNSNDTPGLDIQQNKYLNQNRGKRRLDLRMTFLT